MQGFSWVRLAAIVALFFGSLYVLAPTVLQEDLDTRLAARAAEVEAPSGSKDKPDLDVAFTVTGGDAEAAANVLKARLDAAGVDVRTVEARDGEVHVLVNSGQRPKEVVRLARRPGEVVLYGSAALPAATEPVEGQEAPAVPANIVALVDGTGLDAAEWGPRVVAGANAAPAADAEQVESTLSGLSATDEGVITGSLNGGIPEETGFLVAAVDGKLVAAVTAEADKVVVTPLPGVADGDLFALLSSGGLGATLTEKPDEVAPAPEPEQVAEAPVKSAVPDWVLGMLPNTMINLGLDLQGGVDITLQVGLDEAVQSNVSRDAARLKQAAEKAEFAVAGVRSDRVDPVFWVETDAELGLVTEFVRQHLGIEYVYSTTDGNRHGFEMAETRQAEVKEQAVEQVLETLRKRVDATGVKEPSIVRKGGGRINVQLPGEVDLQAAVDAIGTTAVLEFYMRDHEFDLSNLQKFMLQARDALPADQYGDDMTLMHWLWDNDYVSEDRMVLHEWSEDAEGNRERTNSMVFKNDVVLTGSDVNSAGVGFDQNNQPQVSLSFKPRGGRIFCELTTANVRKQFGIVLDGELKSSPSIREPICGGSASIDMAGSLDALQEAQTLSLVLRTGSLDAPVDIGGVSQIGAQLGADSIKQGSIAAIGGGLIVLVFMGLFYRTAGLLADLALALNVLLVLACLATFGATLTLPGIAGIALTVGMAVDANIIIFERIREELKLGIHPRKAVDTGFDKGLVAVLDANVTTMIAGIVLYSYGTGPIKGFAVTLLVGIITTLVTALFVTRTFMDVVTRNSAARLRI